MDKNLSNLLQWSIENTIPNDTPQANLRTLDPELLAHLMGGPSDADLMKSSMAAIQSPNVPHEEKLIAFDNFEQLIEQIDNANNLEALGLWTPLVELLGSEAGNDEIKVTESADLRRMAAWCIGTAVQNNPKSQERVSSKSSQFRAQYAHRYTGAAGWSDTALGQTCDHRYKPKC